MNVALLPTGRTEWRGLPNALAVLFPNHHFYALPDRKEIDSFPEQFPYHGFTSTPLRLQHETTPPEAVGDLIGRASPLAPGGAHVRSWNGPRNRRSPAS